MSVPFTKERVFRFLLICAIAAVAVYLLFIFLMQVRGHEGIVPANGSGASSSLASPARSGAGKPAVDSAQTH